MKHSIFLLSIAIFFLITSCKKSLPDDQINSKDFIATAKNYFENSQQMVSSANTRFSALKTINWNMAKVIDFLKYKAVVAQVQYLHPFYMGSSVDKHRMYQSNEITWLLVYKDNLKNYHAEQVTFFPDSNYQKKQSFTGLIAVDSWGGNSLKKFKLGKNNTILQANINTDVTGVTENGLQENMIEIVATCYESYGYNYSVDDPDNGTYWSQPAGCSYSISSDWNEGGSYGNIASGGSGGGSISPANSFSVLNGNNVIGNIVDYNKCYTNIAGQGNTFSVTVCVDQPKPGTRQTWIPSLTGAAGSSFGGDNPITSGHTFLIFTQTSGAGSITRNVGFYPSGPVTPNSPASAGLLNNDDQHGYNISVTIPVNNSQFFNMLNFIDQSPGLIYNLNSFNCTSFAIKALYQGNVILPSTIGIWPGGSGNDPGDLGEDIMGLNLSGGMTRSTTSISHPNLGTCN